MNNELQNLLNSIESADYSEYPYENLYVTNLFSDDFYNKMLDNLPGTESYFNMSGIPTKSSIARKTLPIGRDYIKKLPHKFHNIWKEVADIFCSDELKKALYGKFKKTIRHEHCDPYPILHRDHKDYKKGPHCDIQAWKRNGRVMNLLMYLPPDNSHEDCGTIVNTKDGKEHKRYKFHRNSACAFAIGENSWHSVAPLTDEKFVRNSLLVAYHIPDEKGIYDGYLLYTDELGNQPHQ